MIDAILHWLPWCAAAYVIGSVPFGVLIGRARGIDIRAHGSRNIGATNVGRVLGRKLGLACLVLDMLKGAIPVTAAGWERGVLGADAVAAHDLALWFAVAAAAVGGHCASVFLRLRGGKGVATGFGGILGIWPFMTVPAIAALVVWILLRKATHYVSVASMGAALSLPVSSAVVAIARSEGNAVGALRGSAWPIGAMAALAAFVVWRHRSNIGRLRRGEEPRS